MARQGLSQKQIIAAITALAAQGRDLTVTAIRDQLGTGSYSTISAVLAEWRREKERTQDKPAPDIPENVSHLLGHLWKEAWRSADSVYEPERLAFGQKQEQFAAVKEELTAEIRRLEGELEKALAAEQSCREALGKRLEEDKAMELRLAKAEGALRLLEEQEKNLRADNQRLHSELTSWIERATNAETKLHLGTQEEKKSRKSFAAAGQNPKGARKD